MTLPAPVMRPLQLSPTPRRAGAAGKSALSRGTQVSPEAASAAATAESAEPLLDLGGSHIGGCPIFPTTHLVTTTSVLWAHGTP
jgi:hypothetical protein